MLRSFILIVVHLNLAVRSETGNDTRTQTKSLPSIYKAVNNPSIASYVMLCLTLRVKKVEISEYQFRVLIVTDGHLRALKSKFHSTSVNGLGTNIETAYSTGQLL